MLFWSQAVSQPLLGLLPLTILLFPDGRLPSRRWRWLLYGYFAVGLADVPMSWAMRMRSEEQPGR